MPIIIVIIFLILIEIMFLILILITILSNNLICSYFYVYMNSELFVWLYFMHELFI